MKPIDLTPYRDAVRERICSLCLDHQPGGGCARPTADPCALETHLDTVVESILSVEPTRDLEPYVRALRVINCSQCREDEFGDCELRDLVECALDSYVLQVVQVVEDVAAECGHGRFAAGV